MNHFPQKIKHFFTGHIFHLQGICNSFSLFFRHIQNIPPLLSYTLPFLTLITIFHFVFVKIASLFIFLEDSGKHGLRFFSALSSLYALGPCHFGFPVVNLDILFVNAPVLAERGRSGGVAALAPSAGEEAPDKEVNPFEQGTKTENSDCG